MFRENVLTRPDIIERIAGAMVPVALDIQKLEDRGSAESRFLKPLLEQRDQDQGVWIFAPDGKALGGFVGFGDMAGRTKKVIDEALNSFGAVAPRRTGAGETHPHRGKGVKPDGSVDLAVTVRRWGNALHSHGKSPVISSFTLSGKEFRALAPRQALPETEWTVLDEVAKRFCRITSPLCYQHAPQPDWVTGVRMQARVRAIDGDIARLSYEGKISSAHIGAGGEKISDQETEFTGEGIYDLRAEKLRSLLVVGSGALRWSEAPDRPATFHALVEWMLEGPGRAAGE